MEYNKYLKNKIIFLVIKLLISTIIGQFSILIGIVSAFIFMFDFFHELTYNKFFLKTNKNKQFNIGKSVPFPFLIVNNKTIINISDMFKSRFTLDYGAIGNITDLIPEYENGVRRQKVNFFDAKFVLYAEDIDFAGKGKSVIIYFVEMLYGMDNPKKEYEPVVTSLVFIDNYEEVRNQIEESKRPLLSAMIDKRVNNMASEIGGIARKFEKDRYLLVFYKDKLDYLKEKNFKVLKDVRDITLGNKLPVTLSIGMGVSKESIKTSMDYARQSIDLALGRGGDQVLIKTAEGFSFYGGNSKEFETNYRVLARVKTYALEELIAEAHNVLIMGHKNPDLDCLGAAVGVHAIVALYGKKSNIVLSQVTTSINILYDKLVEEDKYKNVFITEKKALNKLTDNTLVIVVDTHRPGLVENRKILDKAKKNVVIDHHRKSADEIKNPVLVYHEPSSSSTCELITEMMFYLKNTVNLLPIEADALLSGITLDTKNFAFKTGAKTFEAAGFLKRKGANSTRVRMLFQYNIESYKAKASVVNNFTIFNDNMAYSICPSNIENPGLVSAQSADDLLNIYGIEASFVFFQKGNEINISARSLGEVNVQIIMEKLGGGGHQTASGTQIESDNLDDCINLLKKTIEKYELEGIK